MLVPLRRRDFTLLSAGSAVSLLGDGFLAVALAFQVYELSNVPTALSVVSLTWTIPMVLLLLVGGAISDRFDRRFVMAAADILRAVVIGAVGFLSVGGHLQLWHLFVLLPWFGAGSAFFNPASGALLPDIVPAGELVQANAFQRTLRPLMLQLLGPALGGVLVGAAGPGPAFLFDGVSFLISAAAVLAIRRRPVMPAVRTSIRGTMHDIGEGLRYVCTNAWCGASLAGYSIGLLASTGPSQVLLPFLVKNTLQAGPTGFGAILAVGGVGAMAAAFVAGQRGLPRRRIVATCLLWAGYFLGIGLYGVITAVWQGLVIAFVINALHAFGLVIWFTLLQTRVPRDMLGRVTSIDWLVSYALVPASFALTGPVSAALGVRSTFIAAGLVGGIGMLAPLLLPAMHRPPRADDIAAGTTQLRHGAAPPG